MRRVFAVCVLLGMASSLYGFDLREGEVLSAFSANYVLHENGFAVARIITPASEATEGQTEVVFANGAKAWVKHTLPTHKVRRGELQVGDIVVWNYSHSSYQTEENYRAGPWYLGTVTGVHQLSGGFVEVNGVAISRDWVRVPDEPVELVIDLREGEVLAAFQAGSSAPDSAYAAATSSDPAAVGGEGGGEVVFANGVSAQALYVISTHRARKEEIEVGDQVLFNENFSNSWTEVNYRFGAWYFGKVTDVGNLPDGYVEVNGVQVPLVWIRLEGEARPSSTDSQGIAKPPLSVPETSSAKQTPAREMATPGQLRQSFPESQSAVNFPDLEIIDLVQAPGWFSSDKKNLVFTVRNHGDTISGKRIDIRYLAIEAFNSDWRIIDETISRTLMFSNGNTETFSVEVDWPRPSDYPKLFFVAMIDPDNRIGERNEFNNLIIRRLCVGCGVRLDSIDPTATTALKRACEGEWITIRGDLGKRWGDKHLYLEKPNGRRFRMVVEPPESPSGIYRFYVPYRLKKGRYEVVVYCSDPTQGPVFRSNTLTLRIREQKEEWNHLDPCALAQALSEEMTEILGYDVDDPGQWRADDNLAPESHPSAWPIGPLIHAVWMESVRGLLPDTYRAHCAFRDGGFIKRIYFRVKDAEGRVVYPRMFIRNDAQIVENNPEYDRHIQCFCFLSELEAGTYTLEVEFFYTEDYWKGGELRKSKSASFEIP